MRFSGLRQLFLCTVCWLCSFQNGVVAAEMQVLLIADTASHTGEAAALDAERIRHELRVLAKCTGHHVHVRLLSGSAVTAKQISGEVNALQLGADDVVMFYYLGHGFRRSTKNSPLPYLYFCTDGGHVDLSAIVDAVIAKHPRMAWIVADCCNNVADEDGALPWQCSLPKGAISQDLAAGYQALFNEFEGIVVACGSEAGDYAYCHKKGHFYTEALWKSLHREVRSPDPQWVHLLDRASHQVAFLQTPYYEILHYP